MYRPATQQYKFGALRTRYTIQHIHRPKTNRKQSPERENKREPREITIRNRDRQVSIHRTFAFYLRCRITTPTPDTQVQEWEVGRAPAKALCKIGQDRSHPLAFNCGATSQQWHVRPKARVGSICMLLVKAIVVRVPEIPPLSHSINILYDYISGSSSYRNRIVKCCPFRHSEPTPPRNNQSV
eukprot:COSAG05_NODE_302_length_11841_cov_253.738801_5_plen_183_part_00